MNTFARRLNSLFSLVRKSWGQRRKAKMRRHRPGILARTQLSLEALEDRMLLSSNFPAAPPLAQLAVIAPGDVTAGQKTSVKVAALDSHGKVMSNFTGTIQLTSSDSKSNVPSSYTFKAADHGSHKFSVVLDTAGNESITAADGAIKGQTHIKVAPGVATHFALSTSSSDTAGKKSSVKVKALDAYGNVATGYTGTVHLHSSDPKAKLPSAYTFKASDHGSHTFTVELDTAGKESITAADGAVKGQTHIKIAPGVATHFALSTSSSDTAGRKTSLTVKALDAYGNVATGYRGTVHLSSNDAQAQLPADYTFTAADRGSHTFTLTLDTAGKDSLTATDTVDGRNNGQVSLAVAPAAANKFEVGAPSATPAGQTVALTVTALDKYGNVVTGYTDTVHFSNSKMQAQLPADYTFTTADRGSHNFTFTLDTVGQYKIKVTDTADGHIKGNTKVTVTPAVASFKVSAPTSALTGKTVSITVTARDASGHVVTDYTGGIDFSTDDFTETSPLVYNFTAADRGKLTFTYSWNDPGSHPISITDDATGTLTGQTSIQLNPGPPTSFFVSWPQFYTSVVDKPVSIEVVALEPNGDIATGYTGTIHFSSSDPLTIPPTDYKFTAADGGTHMFTITPQSLGILTVTVTDTASGIDGESAFSVTPPPGAPTHFLAQDASTLLNGAFIGVAGYDANNLLVSDSLYGLGSDDILWDNSNQVAAGVTSLAIGSDGKAFYLSNGTLYHEGDPGFAIANVQSIASVNGTLFYLQSGDLYQLGQSNALATGVSQMAASLNGPLYYLEGGNLYQFGQSGVLESGVSQIAQSLSSPLYYLQDGYLNQLGGSGWLASGVIKIASELAGELFYQQNQVLSVLYSGLLNGVGSNGVISYGVTRFVSTGTDAYYLTTGRNLYQVGRYTGPIGTNVGSFAFDGASLVYLSSLSTTSGYAPGYSAQYLETGSSVTIYGSGFRPGMKVQFGFGGTQAEPTAVDPNGAWLTVNVPRFAASGPLTLIMPDGTSLSSVQSFTVHDYLNTFGFNFENYDFNVTWGMVKGEFGGDQVDITAGIPFTSLQIDTGVPSPFGLAYWGAAAALLNGKGACFGMALTSDLLAAQGQNVYSLPETGGLLETIDQNHLAQTSAEMLNYLAGWALSGHNSQGIYNQLSGLLARGDHPIITLGSGGSGHAVVAYDVEPGYKGNGDYYIDVYDPNLPFGSVSEQYSRIYIDPSSGWSYNPQGWSGGYGPSGMMVIPTSVLSGQLTMPASLSGLAKFVFGSADPEALKEAVGRTSV